MEDNPTMEKEMDEVLYNETISDFASLMQDIGVRRVALDFKNAFPDLAVELIRCLSINDKQEAALFKAK